MISTARLRAHHVLHDAGLGHLGALERVDSAVNEVWYAGPYVVRISATPGTRRLEYEASVAAVLPPEAGYPEIVTYGRADFAEWLIVRRLEGEVLSRAWPRLSERTRRDAVTQLGEALHRLHVTEPPRDARGGVVVPPFLEGESLECPHQLPVTRLLAVLRLARPLAHVDNGMLDAAVARVDAAADALDDFTADHGLVHGDLHFENVLWADGRMRAMLDFEWARRGPADLDLDVMLRFCAEPRLHVAGDYQEQASRDDYRPVPGWLRDVYPDLFEHPRLNDRLFLYCLSYDIRELVADPPTRPASELSPHHPVNRVRALVEGRAHLPWIDW